MSGNARGRRFTAVPVPAPNAAPARSVAAPELLAAVKEGLLDVLPTGYSLRTAQAHLLRALGNRGDFLGVDATGSGKSLGLVAGWRCGGVAAWRRGGVAVWRCASRQRRACAAEGELRVSCVRAATSSRAYGVARMRRRQTAARLVAALWCSRMSWRGPLFGSRSGGCGGRAVVRVSLRVSLLCARSLEVSWEGRITVDTCTCVPAACALGREAVKYQLMGLTITRLPP